MSESAPYNLSRPSDASVPILLSLPHRGVEFPPELAGQFIKDLAKLPDDTDLFLERLYDFVSDLGVTIISARYSRWVIDLNRAPGDVPLYADGRFLTGLCPTTDFFGHRIYCEESFEPDAVERARRLEEYYFPYHRMIGELLSELGSISGRVLFFDGHSIRRSVPLISPAPFPDLILGNDDERTAAPDVSAAAFEALGSAKWEVARNSPFKGGYLTRSIGDPGNGIHALQLEMSKDLYMDATETRYDGKKAAPVKDLLRSVFESLIPFFK